MKTAGDKAGEKRGQRSGRVASRGRVVSGRTRTEERDSDRRMGLQGGGGEGAETARQKEGGSRGGLVGRTGEGEDCELASDVALPFLGFTSFIRRVAGSSRAVELRFLLFWKHTKSENSRYCGCKGLKCFLFRGRAGLGWAGLGRGGDSEGVKRKPRTDKGRIVKAQDYAMHKHARTTTRFLPWSRDWRTIAISNPSREHRTTGTHCASSVHKE